MKPETIAKLHRINQEFYQTFAGSFASTRRRVQPGVRRVLEQISANGRWLDIGCGSGALAVELARQGRSGIYHGLDFSEVLLAKAEKEIDAFHGPKGLDIRFSAADLMAENWTAPFENKRWDGLLCFAVMHHIPGAGSRERLCAKCAGLTESGRRLYLSVWQPLNSPRLVKRLQPWTLAGVNEADLEIGDVLMDWRAEAEKGQAKTALRYVHCFNEGELRLLAQSAGFRVADCFYSDGKEGTLGLYQTWEKL